MDLIRVIIRQCQLVTDTQTITLDWCQSADGRTDGRTDGRKDSQTDATKRLHYGSSKISGQ